MMRSKKKNLRRMENLRAFALNSALFRIEKIKSSGFKIPGAYECKQMFALRSNDAAIFIRLKEKILILDVIPNLICDPEELAVSWTILFLTMNASGKLGYILFDRWHFNDDPAVHFDLKEKFKSI